MTPLAEGSFYGYLMEASRRFFGPRAAAQRSAAQRAAAVHASGPRVAAAARGNPAFHHTTSGSSVASGPPDRHAGARAPVNAGRPWLNGVQTLADDAISEIDPGDDWRAEWETQRLAAVQLARVVIERYRPPAPVVAPATGRSRFVALFQANAPPTWEALPEEEIGREQQSTLCGIPLLKLADEEDMVRCIRFVSRDFGRDWSLRKRR